MVNRHEHMSLDQFLTIIRRHKFAIDNPELFTTTVKMPRPRKPITSDKGRSKKVKV